jgi:hypothetical protein
MDRQRGTILVELLGMLVLIGVTVGAVALRYQSVGNPLDISTSLLEGELREARLNAIATMSAYRVTPAAANRLRGEKGATCSATTWNVDSSLSSTLPAGVTMSPTSWSVCYSSRGISTANTVVTLSHSTLGTRRIEVLVGGATRVIP